MRASKGCVNVWYTLSAQPVDATQALNLSAGVNKIKQLAFIQLASIRLWLRVYEFTALVSTVDERCAYEHRGTGNVDATFLLVNGATASAFC